LRSHSKAGARTALLTAQPAGGLARYVDIVIPAQTTANDQGDKLSVLPMGSLFETAQMIAFELVILKLRPRFNETSETMRAAHQSRVSGGDEGHMSTRPPVASAAGQRASGRTPVFRRAVDRGYSYGASFQAFTKVCAARATSSTLAPGL
jgi:hypothetical protein